MTNVAPLVNLDLDSIERPEAERNITPFTFNLRGRVITMTDPEEFDWRDLLEIEKPQQFLGLALSDDDRAYFRQQSMPGWKVGRLMQAYMAHYNMEKKIQEARRQQAAGI